MRAFFLRKKHTPLPCCRIADKPCKARRISLKGGFTLVELIVAMTIMVIFSVCALTVLAPVMNVYYEVADNSDAGYVAGNVIDKIRGEISIANNATITNSSTLTINGAYDLSVTPAPDATGGYLTRSSSALSEPTYVFDKAYYRNKTIALQFSNAGSSAITINLTVFDRDGSEEYNLNATVRPLKKLLRP